MEDHFNKNGSLSKLIEGFKHRPEQGEMAKDIFSAIENQTTLVAEAGTGTGKTFAYLIPALSSKGRVIISTGTKTLQEQIYEQDIPRVKKALGSNIQVAILKGRANYVCHYFLNRRKKEGHFDSKYEVSDFEIIEEFVRSSQTGDLSQCDGIAETSEIWDSIVSTRDNCLGTDCEFYEKCFVAKARSRAMRADIVVINHYLFFADIVLRELGLSELLPTSNAVLFDEAHLVPEVASLFFGESVTTGQIIDLARDSKVEAKENAEDSRELLRSAKELESFTKFFYKKITLKNTRFDRSLVKDLKYFKTGLSEIKSKMESLIAHLEINKDRSDGLANCHTRGVILFHKLSVWDKEDGDDDFVSWIEKFSSSIHFNRTPLNISNIFREYVGNRNKALVFTSATLSINNDFSHFINQLGLDNAVTKTWDSPYDYKRNARLFLPRGLPDPNDDDYTRSVVSAALPLILAAKGRTFFLFTSNQAMLRAEALLNSDLRENGATFPLLTQGVMPKSILLKQFRKLGNAILLGTMSFWEGVDVRGTALSLVIIDRLPFEPPDDPVLSAKVKMLRKKGKNPFLDYQLPRAILTLRQGAGRLIRDENDTGVLMICDPRLVSKSYGKKIWTSLPAMTRSRDTEKMKIFLKSNT